jgi:hypothetical protein
MLAHHLLLESFLLQLIFALRVVRLRHGVCFLGFMDLAPPLGFSPRSFSLVPLLFLVPSNEPVHRVKSARCRHPSVLSVDLILPWPICFLLAFRSSRSRVLFTGLICRLIGDLVSRAHKARARSDTHICQRSGLLQFGPPSVQ